MKQENVDNIPNIELFKKYDDKSATSLSRKMHVNSPKSGTVTFEWTRTDFEVHLLHPLVYFVLY